MKFISLILTLKC